MNIEQKNEIKTAQLNALLERLKEKKPLTAAQLQYLHDEFPVEAESTKVNDDETDYIASSANDLANRLGVHRQVIAYHKGRSGSPQGLSVKVWRKYLAIMGKLPTAAKMEGSAPTGTKCTEPFDADTAFAILFNDFSEVLGAAVKIGVAAAGLKVSSRKADVVAWNAWMVLAARYQRLAHQHGASGPFDPVNDEGRCEYPTAIVNLVARLGKAMPKGKIPAEKSEG